jgi:hypothetical protein
MATKTMIRNTLLCLVAAVPFLAASHNDQGPGCPATTGGEMPLKYKGPATVPDISACDLMTRLYIYSDDSMLGRKVGTADNLRSTAYIESEVRKMGLKPAGDSGGYFQYIGLYSSRGMDSISTITVGAKVFKAGKDFTATIESHTKKLAKIAVVYGGVAGDTTDVLSPAAVKGKMLVFLARPVEAGAAGGQAFGGRGGGRGGRGGAVQLSPAQQALAATTKAAAMVVTIVGDQIPTARGLIAGNRAGHNGIGHGTLR